MNALVLTGLATFRLVGKPEVILGRHFLAGESEFSWEIPASSVKYRIADRPSPDRSRYRNVAAGLQRGIFFQ